jgi:hypothetical protein
MTVKLLMKRFVVYIGVLVCAAVMPCVALAAAAQAVHGAVSGEITYIGESTLTIQTGGRPLGVVNALSATANALSVRDYPYVYGGGHGEAGVASVGIKGPGYNGRRIGFDCSGSVAAALAGAGLWPAGSGVPNDAGVITQLLQEKLIARGPGVAPDEVTLYDDPGVHIFMNIDGRFFGTSDGGGGDPKGGPTWLDDGAPDSWSPAYKRYHVVASVLKNKTTYGHSFTFQTSAYPSIINGAEPGDKVKISYAETRSGSMNASAIEYVGAITTRGTVSSIATNGSSIMIETTSDHTLTFSTSAVTNLIYGLQVGDGVQVTYGKDASGLLIPHAVKILSAPSTPQPTGPTSTAPMPPTHPTAGTGPYRPGADSAR